MLPRWKCEGCGRLEEELYYCAHCWKMVCPDYYDPYVGTCVDYVVEMLRCVPVSTYGGLVSIADKQATKGLIQRKEVSGHFFLQNEMEKTQWNAAKCCMHPFLRHDKVRGEIFCVSCGTVIVEKTIGQIGRKGADRGRRGDCLKMKLKGTISPQVIEEEDWYWLWENEEEDEAEEENDHVRLLLSEVFLPR